MLILLWTCFRATLQHLKFYFGPKPTTYLQTQRDKSKLCQERLNESGGWNRKRKRTTKEEWCCTNKSQNSCKTIDGCEDDVEDRNSSPDFRATPFANPMVSCSVWTPICNSWFIIIFRLLFYMKLCVHRNITTQQLYATESAGERNETYSEKKNTKNWLVCQRQTSEHMNWIWWTYRCVPLNLNTANSVFWKPSIVSFMYILKCTLDSKFAWMEECSLHVVCSD